MKICRGPLLGCVGLGFCVMLACVEPARAAQPEMSGSIKEMMSPEEFKAAGLNKLSAEELQKLDAWLQGYRQVTEQAAEKKATARASAESTQDGSNCQSRGWQLSGVDRQDHHSFGRWNCMETGKRGGPVSRRKSRITRRLQ